MVAFYEISYKIKIDKDTCPDVTLIDISIEYHSTAL